MRSLEENDKPLTAEEIEKQKSIVDKIYKQEKEEREEYFKVTEGERKKAFEESKALISKLISEKAFIRDKYRQEDLERMMQLHRVVNIDVDPALKSCEFR